MASLARSKSGISTLVIHGLTAASSYTVGVGKPGDALDARTKSTCSVSLVPRANYPFAHRRYITRTSCGPEQTGVHLVKHRSAFICGPLSSMCSRVWAYNCSKARTSVARHLFTLELSAYRRVLSGTVSKRNRNTWYRNYTLTELGAIGLNERCRQRHLVNEIRGSTGWISIY